MSIENTRERKIRPAHPGEMLREDFLTDYGLTVSGLAKSLGVSRQTVNELLRERRAVTPEMAIRLSRLFGNTPEFWLNAQRAVDLWDAEKTLKKQPPSNQAPHCSLGNRPLPGIQLFPGSGLGEDFAACLSLARRAIAGLLGEMIRVTLTGFRCRTPGRPQPTCRYQKGIAGIMKACLDWFSSEYAQLSAFSSRRILSPYCRPVLIRALLCNSNSNTPPAIACAATIRLIFTM